MLYENAENVYQPSQMLLETNLVAKGGVNSVVQKCRKRVPTNLLAEDFCTKIVYQLSKV